MTKMSYYLYVLYTCDNLALFNRHQANNVGCSFYVIVRMCFIDCFDIYFFESSIIYILFVYVAKNFTHFNEFNEALIADHAFLYGADQQRYHSIFWPVMGRVDNPLATQCCRPSETTVTSYCCHQMDCTIVCPFHNHIKNV